MSGTTPGPATEFPGHTPYVLPDFRSPSPASSLGTNYDPDATSQSDLELDDESWEKKMQELLAFGEMSEAERLANEDPKLPIPKSSAEERQLHEQVMAKLRAAVAQLGEDERFEQLARRGSRIETQVKPSSSDLNVILQSLMAIPMGQNNGPTSHYRNHVKASSGDFDIKGTSLTPIPPPQPSSDDTKTESSATTTGPGRKSTRRRGTGRKT